MASRNGIEHRWQGWLDPPLSRTGEEQAAVRARALAHDGFRPRTIFTSDLRPRPAPPRSSALISRRRSCPISVSANATAVSGRGTRRARSTSSGPARRDAWRRGEIAAPPGGETEEHGVRAVRRRARRARSHRRDGVMLIVTHGGVLRMVATAREAARAAAWSRTSADTGSKYRDGHLADPEPVS